MFTKDLTLKLVVLFIVLIIWLQQSMFKTHRIEIPLPIDIKNIPEGMILYELSDDYVSVIAEGRGIDLIAFKKTDYDIEIDAGEFRQGDNEVILTESNFIIRDSQYLGLIRFYLNKKVNIVFDALVSQKIPVEPRYLTIEDENYFLQRRISISPQLIEIEGPKKVIDGIRRITTIPLSASYSDEDVYSVELELPEDVVSMKPDVVDIILEVPSSITKMISMISIEYPQNENIKIVPDYVTAVIEGLPERLQNVTASDIKAFISIPDNYEYDFIPIIFQLPNGVSLVEYTPQRVQLLKDE